MRRPSATSLHSRFCATDGAGGAALAPVRPPPPPFPRAAAAMSPARGSGAASAFRAVLGGARGGSRMVRIRSVHTEEEKRVTLCRGTSGRRTGGSAGGGPLPPSAPPPLPPTLLRPLPAIDSSLAPFPHPTVEEQTGTPPTPSLPLRRQRRPQRQAHDHRCDDGNGGGVGGRPSWATHQTTTPLPGRQRHVPTKPPGGGINKGGGSVAAVAAVAAGPRTRRRRCRTGTALRNSSGDNGDSGGGNSGGDDSGGSDSTNRRRPAAPPPKKRDVVLIQLRRTPRVGWGRGPARWAPRRSPHPPPPLCVPRPGEPHPGRG